MEPNPVVVFFQIERVLSVYLAFSLHERVLPKTHVTVERGDPVDCLSGIRRSEFSRFGNINVQWSRDILIKYWKIDKDIFFIRTIISWFRKCSLNQTDECITALRSKNTQSSFHTVTQTHFYSSKKHPSDKLIDIHWVCNNVIVVHRELYVLLYKLMTEDIRYLFRKHLQLNTRQNVTFTWS